MQICRVLQSPDEHDTSISLKEARDVWTGMASLPQETKKLVKNAISDFENNFKEFRLEYFRKPAKLADALNQHALSPEDYEDLSTTRSCPSMW